MRTGEMQPVEEHSSKTPNISVARNSFERDLNSQANIRDSLEKNSTRGNGDLRIDQIEKAAENFGNFYPFKLAFPILS